MFNYPSKKSDNENAGAPMRESDAASEWEVPFEGAPGEGNASEFIPEERSTSPFGESAPGTPSSSTRNVLNSDVTVVGTLRFTDELLVDGSVEGEIQSDGILTVGANATIQAGEKKKEAIRTKSAIIHGKVTGDVVVTDRVQVAATAELIGDVTAAKISIEEGAVFIGHCMVGNVAAMPPQSSSTAKRSSAKRTPDPQEDDTPNLLG